MEQRIINVDLDLSLRIIGNSSPSLEISTDEGDGYTFMKEWNVKDNINTDLKPEFYHYQEWIGQLEHIIEKLKQMKLKDK
jgi:hypothetical protein